MSGQDSRTLHEDEGPPAPDVESSAPFSATDVQATGDGMSLLEFAALLVPAVALGYFFRDRAGGFPVFAGALAALVGPMLTYLVWRRQTARRGRGPLRVEGATVEVPGFERIARARIIDVSDNGMCVFTLGLAPHWAGRTIQLVFKTPDEMHAARTALRIREEPEKRP